ncbi:MAG: 4-hydroxythreonine-4-phosphate dehydrogenase PdxA [Pseudomonadota bacterium]
MTQSEKPVLALAMGDPAGVGPELTAKALADPEIRAAADFVVFGDRRVLEMGARHAHVDPIIEMVTEDKLADGAVDSSGTVFVDLAHFDPAGLELGVVSEAGGASAIANFKKAIAIAASGQAGAVTFTPFNKAAMRLAHPAYEDEVVFLNEVLGFDGKASEFNILPGLWNARVTSHVPISGVAELITRAAVFESLKLTHDNLRAAGFESPRIAVAALNPHAGDGGNFGSEDSHEIAPAVADGKAAGLACDGPFPSDTVFVRAQRGDFDAVLTMYHDQGQIAMKLIGFDAGVTLLGGYPFPICTPAHGTAYDIAGEGIADLGATKNALLLAAKMAPPPETATKRTAA